MASFWVNMPSCLVGVEACASAYSWANNLMTMSHNVKLMAPSCARSYIKTNQHTAQDTEAIGKPSHDPICDSYRLKSLIGTP